MEGEGSLAFKTRTIARFVRLLLVLAYLMNTLIRSGVRLEGKRAKVSCLEYYFNTQSVSMA